MVVAGSGRTRKEIKKKNLSGTWIPLPNLDGQHHSNKSLKDTAHTATGQHREAKTTEESNDKEKRNALHQVYCEAFFFVVVFSPMMREMRAAANTVTRKGGKEEISKQFNDTRASFCIRCPNMVMGN